MPRSVLFGVLLIIALHAFDEMVLVISLPVISADLGSANWYGLIIASYILASSLVFAALSWNTLSFMIARILQGIGGGMGWTISFGLISLLFSDDKKPKAVAAMDVAWIFPSLLAPLVGGILVDYLSWRWIFVVQTLPLLLAVALVYPRIKHLKGKENEKKESEIDQTTSDSPRLLSSIRLTLGCGLMLYLLGTPFDWLWLGLLPAFWIMAKPLHLSMPKDWLKMDNPLSTSLIVACLAFLIFYIMEAYQPLYLIEVRGLSTLQSGLILTCASVCWLFGSQLTANEYIRGNYSQRILIGLAVMSTGIFCLALLIFTKSSLLWAYLFWSIAGFGMGILFNTVRSTAMIYTPPNQEGMVSAAISLSVSMGLCLATGFGGAIKNQANLGNYSLNSAIIAIWIMSMLLAIVSWFLLLWHHRKKFPVQ